MIPEENSIILVDSKGNEIELEFLDVIDHGGHSYAVMAEEGSDEVIIMEQTVNSDGKSATYSDVLNDAVIEEVFNIFIENNE